MQEIWFKPSHMDFDLTGYPPFHFTIQDKQELNINADGGVGLYVLLTGYIDIKTKQCHFNLPILGSLG